LTSPPTAPQDGGMTAEYGERGVVGVLMPPANPTVEPEMAVLLGPDVAVLAARLLSRFDGDRERPVDYLESLDATLEAFGPAPLQVVGFGITSSTYFVGCARESEILAHVRARRGYPVVTAAQAVEAALKALGARRIALLSPYPKWMTDAGIAHWRGRGFEVTQVLQLGELRADTSGIYALGSSTAIAAAGQVRDADAILISGTGMPSLAALDRLNAPGRMPMISSNLCMAWAMDAVLNGGDFAAWLAPDAAWRTRLARMFPAAVRRAT
jgi:maleate isomerase